MTHPFERAGLGQAPFKLRNIDRVFPVGPGVNRLRRGTGSCCDFCGHAIQWVFYCESADGKSFKVGSDCINKVEPPGSPLREEVERQSMEKRLSALRDRVRRAKEVLDADRRLLSDLPHPMLGRPLSMRDYVEFVFKNATQERKLAKACGIVEGQV